MFPESGDPLHEVFGIGGSEYVFEKRVDRLAAFGTGIDRFSVEVGAMEYGFEIDAILGMDFLRAVGAIVDLQAMEIRSAPDVI